MTPQSTLPTWLDESELLARWQVNESQLARLRRLGVIYPKVGVTGRMYHRTTIILAEREHVLKLAKAKQDTYRALVNQRLREGQGKLNV